MSLYKKAVEAEIIISMDDADKVFINNGNEFKQITLSDLLARVDKNTDAVDGARIKDKTLNASKFIEKSITENLLNDGIITTSKLADASVTSAKIADASVTSAKIADANITTAKITDGSITANKIATIASQSIALGNGALSKNTGNYNVAVGYNSLANNTTGVLNVAVGQGAMRLNTIGSSNTAIGESSLYNNTRGSYNVAIGEYSGRYISDNNTTNTSSSNSIYIGYRTMAKANNDTNELVIGHHAKGNGSNTTTIGNTSTTDSYIAGALHVGSIPSVALTGINVGTYAFVEGVEYIVDTTSTNTPISGVSYLIKKYGTALKAVALSGDYLGWTFWATSGSITGSSSWISPFEYKD